MHIPRSFLGRVVQSDSCGDSGDRLFWSSCMGRRCSVDTNFLPVGVARLLAVRIGHGSIGGGIGWMSHAENLRGKMNRFFGRGFARVEFEATECETLYARVRSIRF